MRIGSRVVIAQERVIIPKGERAEFTVTYKDTPFKFVVETLMEWKKPGDSWGFSWGESGDSIQLRFFTRHEVPSVTPNFAQIGTLNDGSRLLLGAEYYSEGGTGVVFLQLMIEELAHA